MFKDYHIGRIQSKVVMLLKELDSRFLRVFTGHDIPVGEGKGDEVRGGRGEKAGEGRRG